MFVSAIIGAKGQNARYELLDSKLTSQTVAKIQLKTFCDKKKYVDYEAECAALRIILFDGLGKSIYSRPLLDSGEKTSFEQFPAYFDNLFIERYSDFVASYNMISKFKKGDKDKSTIYEVEVKVIALRKDLEKNGIKQKIGY